MQKASHISLIITLLTALLLLAGPRCAHAQAVNTGGGPYLNSWHSYRVVVGSTLHTREWYIMNDDSSQVRDLTGATPDWAIVHGLSGSNSDVSIFFVDSVFGVGETWRLRYREYSGPGTCVAARQFTINVVENMLYLTLDADAAACKSQSGSPYNWNDVDDETYQTQFTYRVSLHKNQNFTITGWSFEADIDLTPIGHNHEFVSYTVEVVPSTEGTATIVDGAPYDPLLDGYFKVNLSALATANLDSVSADVIVTVRGLLHEGVTATLNLLNGQATHGVNNNITLDNTGMPTEAIQANAALRDRAKSVVIHPLPDTRNITHGEGETAATASKPLQYSTHKYTVLLSDIGNLSNGATGWNLRTAGGDAVTTGFTITRSASTTADTAIVELNMDPGDYVLYFTEESDDGCRTVRPYPFRLHAPFDVDIALNDPGNDAERCAGVSGTVNNDLGTATETVIAYTVEVNTADYLSGWSFSYAVSTNFAGGFDEGDVEVAAVNVTGGTHTSGSATTGSVTVAGGTTEVTVSVTYRGFYLNEHTLKVALSSITGSFKETDADAVNETTNILNPMPQPGVLAGVE